MRVYWLAAVVLVTLVVIGCGGEKSHPTMAPTRTATAAVSTPTADAVTADHPPKGWNELTGPGVSLWLPTEFKQLDPKTDARALGERLRTLGPEYAGVANVIEQNPDIFSIMALSGDLKHPLFAYVVTEREFSSTTLDDNAKSLVDSLPAGFATAHRDNVTIGGYAARRLAIDITLSGGPRTSSFSSDAPIGAREDVYLVRTGDRLWEVIFAGQPQAMQQADANIARAVKTVDVEPLVLDDPALHGSLINTGGNPTSTCGQSASVSLADSSVIGKKYDASGRVVVVINYDAPGCTTAGVAFRGRFAPGTGWFDYWCRPEPRLPQAACGADLPAYITGSSHLYGSTGTVSIEGRVGTMPPTSINSPPPVDGLELCRVNVTLNDGTFGGSYYEHDFGYLC